MLCVDNIYGFVFSVLIWFLYLSLLFSYILVLPDMHMSSHMHILIYNTVPKMTAQAKHCILRVLFFVHRSKYTVL